MSKITNMKIYLKTAMMKIHSVEVITPVLGGACSGISSRKSLVLKAVLGDRDIHSITLMMIML